METTLSKKLTEIQSALKAPKSQRNTFGNYNYRNCEDILEALKPLLKEHGCTLLLSDSIEMIGTRFYVKATVTLSDGSASMVATAFAREEETKKGMDGAQVTGAASSYARKYALNGLFCIDDTKDADTMDNRQETPQKAVTPKPAAKPAITPPVPPMATPKPVEKPSYTKVLESITSATDIAKLEAMHTRAVTVFKWAPEERKGIDECFANMQKNLSPVPKTPAA